MFGTSGWDNYFKEQKVVASAATGGNRLRVFTPKNQPEGPFDVDSVFSGEALRSHAPKIHKVVESIRKAKGICFAYSRYIKAGALPFAIALERAGFQRRLADGKISPLLKGVSAVPPVCALCGVSHGPTEVADHPFRPACYVLLTSDDELSPKFAGLVRLAARWPNDPEWGPEGGVVKAVIGSQVASEGLDLKCVREMHILDAWYHLNRTDQIIGRGIRYCSHAALRAAERRQELPPLALSNCLIYLHALRPPDFESADMYAYRIAIRKAQAVGRVQRLLKKHAWDCNLELEAITFTSLKPRRQVDAQGIERRSRDADGEELEGWSPNDVDYTTYCDYAVCKEEKPCAVFVPRTEEEGLVLDTSTFGIDDARRIILSKQAIVRERFRTQVMVPETDIKEIFKDLPLEISTEATMELLDGRRFRLTRPDGVTGFLIKRAGYLVFQPAAVTDKDIPMSLRYARAWQLRRRFMDWSNPVLGRLGEQPPPPPPSAITESAAPAASGASGSGAGAVGAAAVATATAKPSEEVSQVLGRWTAWRDWVASGASAGPIPAFIGKSLNIWSWILQAYSSIPETQIVAWRWWFDRQSFGEQRFLLEIAADITVPTEPLAATLNQDIFRATNTVGYRVFNPVTKQTEYFCKSPGSLFRPCSSSLISIIEKTLNKPPVNLSKDMGQLFGFMAAKKSECVFKTLDTTVEIKSSSRGAECGNTSNLSVHRPRVRLLQEAGRTSDLAPLMLPDNDEGYDESMAVTFKKTGRPYHLKDITHQPLCLYMEFLTRIFDARRLHGRRWFLTAAAATAAGLKGAV